MKEIVVFGTGTLGRLAEHFVREEGMQRVAGFTVHTEYLDPGLTVNGLDVFAFESLRDQFSPEQHDVLVAIGYRFGNRRREAIDQEVRQAGFEIASFISQHAQVSPAARVGEGCFVMPGTTLMPECVVGRSAIVCPGAYVGWSSRVGDWCYLAPNSTICGNVSLGQRCFVGAAASVRDGCQVADDCLIGMGVALRHHTTPGQVLRAPSPTLRDHSSTDVPEFQ